MTNNLYFGDCLDVMREDIKDESIDLIYLDPPFNSKRIYNASMDGAQWVAFNDTWHWSEAVDDFHELAEDVDFAPTIEGLRMILGEGPNLAYLSYMANRLRECRRVLKDSGSIYLHCDPTMSHYLKVVMDGIFSQRMGDGQFLNEIVWSYRTGGTSKKWFARKHDTILFYAKRLQAERIFNVLEEKSYTPTLPDPHTNSGKRLNVARDAICELCGKGSPGQKYRMVKMRDTWTDIPSIFRNNHENMGFDTQKPAALLERIIKASSNKGDMVLDPFCGCGTTIESAYRLDRKWIGIDICVKACEVIEDRMRGHFDYFWKDGVEFIGMPKTRDDAKTLAEMDKFRFERWAASIVVHIEANKKQRGDGGIDGRGRIAIRKGQFVDLVCQIKGGGTGPNDVRAFNGARQQAGADLGIFTCFEDKVTQGMRDAAASTGKFMNVPILQIYTIEDFFEGRKPQLPYIA